MPSKFKLLFAGSLLGILVSVLVTHFWLDSVRYQSPKVQNFQAAKPGSTINENVKVRNHAQYKQVTFSKSELEAHPKFWMLGYSEQDVNWLNRFGYPTLDEEATLSQASTEQLSALAKAGDLNAKIHLGVRFARHAVMSGEAHARLLATSMIEQSLIEGGPYQAAKTSDFFVNLLKNSRSLGELNENQRAILQKELLPLYELAKGISSMYGDYAAIREFNAYRNIDTRLGLPESKPMSFEFAMARLANMNKERVRRGLAPYDVVQRPTPVGSPDILSFQAANTVFVR
jgi:hypothetical protein